MDILVTTMNGNAFALQTMVPYDPILTWTEQNQCSRNGGTWRSHYQGVYVLPLSRSFRDVIGAHMRIRCMSLASGERAIGWACCSKPHATVCVLFTSAWTFA